MFVVYCVGSGLCDELTNRSEKSYRVCACVCLCVIYKPQQRGGLGPSWAVAPQKKNSTYTGGNTESAGGSTEYAGGSTEYKGLIPNIPRLVPNIQNIWLLMLYDIHAVTFSGFTLTFNQTDMLEADMLCSPLSTGVLCRRLQRATIPDAV